MQEELFDIVDGDNQPTGEVMTRLEAHSSGAWHRTVHVYYYREEDEALWFLVQLRSKLKDRNPDKWDTRFGGHVKSGETIEKTVIDELKEEIGLVVEFSDLRKGPIRKRDKEENREFTHLFFYKGSKDTSHLHFEDDEVQEVKWMSEGEIIQSMTNEPDEWSGSLEGFRFALDSIKALD